MNTTSTFKTLLLAVTLVICACVPSAAQVTAGLSAYYSFNNGTPHDASGNGNDGIAWKQQLATDRFGNPGQAFHFDGDSSLVFMPDSMLLDPVLTVSLWFRTQAGGVLLGHQSSEYPSTGSQWVPVIYVREDSTLNACFWGAQFEGVDSTEQKVVDGQWHHVVLCANPYFQHLYIDNVRAGTGGAMGVLWGMKYNQIGNGFTSGNWNSNPGGWFAFQGDIDDVRIYRNFLIAPQVDSLYHDPNPGAVVALDHKSGVHNVMLHPNPAHDQVGFSETLPSVRLMDMQGRLVLAASSVRRLSLDGVPRGVYVVAYETLSGYCGHWKLVVE